MAELTPVTRKEIYLAAAGGQEITTPEPVTRLELYLAKLAGMDVEVPEPVTRVEYFLAAACGMEVEKPIPVTRLEMLLDNISGGENDIPPVTRLEMFLAEIKGGEQPVLLTYSGNLPATITAVAHALASLTRYGLCTQDGTPTPDAPVDIVTNNGAIKLRRPSGMPIAYQMVEWLKPAVSIPITGFKTKSTQEIETVFYREQRGASYLYASDSATSGTTNTTAYLTTGAGNWRWDGKSYSISVSSGIKITSIQNEEGVWLNGTMAGWYTDPGDFVSTNDLRLSSNENTTVRIYSMTIREGETVTLDLVPVQRVTDNAYGFYDKVSGNFYTNDAATFEAGDPIDDPVEIYTDGTDEVLTVSGKNLFNPDSAWLFHTPIGFGGGVASWPNAEPEKYPNSVTYFMRVKPNTTYTYSCATAGDRFGVAGENSVIDPSDYTTASRLTFDSILVPLKSSGVGKTYSFTTGANTQMVAVYCALNTVPTDIQIEEGTATAYEPYVSPQTVSVPMLLGVDTVKDEWEAVHGPLTHRIGLYVITGTNDEGWAENTSYSGTFYADCLPAAALITTISMFTRYEGVLGSRSVASMNNGTAKCGSSSNRQRIFIRDTSCADVDALKAKLAGFYADGEPCIVAFALSTETTEQTTANHLVTHKGTNIVDSTANVEPVEAKIEYYGTEVPMLGMMPAPSAPEEPAEEQSEPVEESEER